MRSNCSLGYSLLELMLVVGLVTTLAAVAVPLVSGTIDELHAAGSARYMAARIAGLRLDAVRRSSTMGLRFSRDGSDYVFAPYVDGNGNGLRASDITSGFDRPAGRAERLREQFADTSFGLLPGIPDIDGSTASADGVRIGSSSFLSVAPNGSCTGGTLYIRGRRTQYAVRVLGATGRVRFYRYDMGARRWITR